MSRLKYLNNEDGSMALFDVGQVNQTGDRIVKEALVFVEGTHTDSAKRTHEFSAERVKKIVKNTNKFLAQGGRIPWQRDHLKTQDANLGDLEGPLELRVITEDDLPNPNLRDLVGRLGAFTKALVGKGKDVVDQVISKRISTLSPGIDVINDVIKEISATPTPAITGLSTFKLSDGPVTFDDLEKECSNMEQMREKFDDLTDKLWMLIDNITSSDTVAQTGSTPKDLVSKALEDYKSRVVKMLNFDSTTGVSSSAQGIPGNFDPNYLNKQQETGTTMYQEEDKYTSAFTMADLEDAMYQDAEFGYKKAITSAVKGLSQGKGIGNVAKTTGRKLMNATRGKVSRVAGKLKAVGNSVKNKVLTAMGGSPMAAPSKGVKMSTSQIKRTERAKTRFGVKNPGTTGAVYKGQSKASVIAQKGVESAQSTRMRAQAKAERKQARQQSKAEIRQAKQQAKQEKRAAKNTPRM